MSSFKYAKEKNNEIWLERIETTEGAIEKIYLQLSNDEQQVEDEIEKVVTKHDEWCKKNYTRFVKSEIETTKKKQIERFDNEVSKRKDKLNEKVEDLKMSLTCIVEKRQKKIKKLEADIEKYRSHLHYLDGPKMCEHCDFEYYNDLQKAKHEEGLTHKLNAGIIPPIENGLTCICGTQFTQYHGIKEKNEDYWSCYTSCCHEASSLPDDHREKLYRCLESKWEPIEITPKNRRSVFQWLGILNERNTVSQMVSRLQEAWEYSFGELRKYVSKDDVRRMYLLNEDRDNIYCIEEDGSPVDLCTIEQITDEHEIKAFGEGICLRFSYREKVPYDLRDRNPLIKMPKSGLLRDLPITEDDIKSLGLLNPNRNCWMENPETPEARRVLERVLKDNPDGKKVTRTTTTVAT
tara:strand:- start:895 stop:2112 length:1218 start_codon:yes stop_codon:yes gene_type:complete